ncbi:MAG: response regulator [Pseudomonadota bacterium]
MAPESQRSPLCLAPSALAFLFLLFLSLPAGAHAPPYPILDATERNPLGLYVAWYEDTTGKLTIDDVEGVDPELFSVSDREVLHFGYTRSTYWFRVAMQNARESDETLLLDVPHPQLSTIEFYRPVDGGYAVTRAGTSTARVAGDFDHQNYLFGVTVPAGTTEVFWFRVQSDLSLDFSLDVEMPETFTHAQGISQIVTGLFIGILITMMLFNGVAWAVSREQTFAWYLVFLIAVIGFLLAKLGYIGVLFFRGPGVQPMVECLSGTVATLAGLQFARAFLNTHERQPVIDQGLTYLLLAGLVVLLALPFVEAPQRGPMYTTFAALAMPATLYAAWQAMRLGCPDAPRYLLARLVSACAGGIAVGSELGWLALPFRGASLLVVSASIEALIIALTLYIRRARNRRAAVRDKLRSAIDQAELRARTEFLGRFSRDVRTPLNGILGMTELMGDTSLTPRQREYTMTIRASGENLLALLNETLDWTRLESGQLEIQHVDFDLPQLIADSLETVQLRAEEKHVELVVDIDPSLPARVNGDPSRLRQILCNLLGNAVRYTHRGEVQVQVVPSGQPHVIRIEVRDTGVGIARDQLASLFDNQRAGKDGRHGESRGFGLYIARQLVERMGGRIGAQSEEHRGSIFWVTLPLPAAPDQNTDTDAGILAGKRLLVVDDNAAVRRVIETQASSWRMAVTVADNAQEALAIARTQANLGASFDVVVLDHNMPGMSGLQLAARIKEDPLIRHDALIVMLTGMNIAPTETMARNVGIRRVLTKPVSGRALQQALVEEFARRERFEPDEPAMAPLSPNLRILVVEDNNLSQKVIRGMLAKIGVRSDVVSNGQEALEAIQHQRYDLLLMDCEMPVMDGYEATRRIRAWETDNARRRTPIIALSAHIMNEIKERCLQAGMDAHMAKPVDLNELRDALRVYGQPNGG